MDTETLLSAMKEAQRRVAGYVVRYNACEACPDYDEKKARCAKRQDPILCESEYYDDWWKRVLAHRREGYASGISRKVASEGFVLVFYHRVRQALVGEATVFERIRQEDPRYPWDHRFAPGTFVQYLNPQGLERVTTTNLTKVRTLGRFGNFTRISRLTLEEIRELCNRS